MFYRYPLILCFLCIVIATPAFCKAPQKNPIIHMIQIRLNQFNGNYDQWNNMARRLIFIKEGDHFSEKRLAMSIDALKISKKFKSIHVDSNIYLGMMVLIFDLTPFHYIKNIIIYGEYPLYEKDILNTMTVYTGDAFVDSEMPTQKKIIEDRLTREGFIHPQVTIQVDQDPTDLNYLLYIHIQKGPYYRLKNLTLNGVSAFYQTRLKTKMLSYRLSFRPGSAGRFLETILQKDIRLLTDFYRKKGYPDVSIQYDLTKNPTNKTIDANITIQEGKRYHIIFKGNASISKRKLLASLDIFKESNKFDRGIRKATQAIRTIYSSYGFIDAFITTQDITPKDRQNNERWVCFQIEEGIRTRVKKIAIMGNHYFTKKDIESRLLLNSRTPLILPPFVETTLEDDLNAIKMVYLQEGFSQVMVQSDIQWSPDKKLCNITIQINEGPQTIVSEVRLVGNTIISDDIALKLLHLTINHPYREYMVRSDENTISAFFSEKGYPHIQVKGNVTFSKDYLSAQVIYHIEPGPYVRMGKTYLTGNFRTKDWVIKNEMMINTNDPLSLTRLLDSQKNIRNLDIFNAVKFKAIGLKEKADQVNLFVDVEERKPYFFHVGGGYDTSRGGYIQSQTGDYNFMGANRLTTYGFEMSEIGYRGEATIKEPRLFRTRFSSIFSTFSERRSEFNQPFGTITHGASLGINRKIRHYLTFGMNVQFEQREKFTTQLETNTEESDDETTSDSDIEEEKKRTVTVFTPFAYYDTRDSFMRPRSGLFCSASVDISKGVKNSLDDYLKYRFDMRLYISPFSWLTLAGDFRTSYLSYLKMPDSIPEDRLMFLGGTSTIRGFDENMLFNSDDKPIGGRSLIYGNVEARIDVAYGFECALFYDSGAVRYTSNSTISDNPRSSFGVAFRYITPIGPIGFIYGLKINKNENEDPGRLHFSLGYTF